MAQALIDEIGVPSVAHPPSEGSITPSDDQPLPFDPRAISAWIQGPHVRATGSPVELSARGSYSTAGKLTTYEWDLNGDGEIDRTATEPTLEYTWEQEYVGEITLKVTDSSGNSASTQAKVMITNDGDTTPYSRDNCPETYNYGQTDYDEDGIGDNCDSTPGMPTEGRPDVEVGLISPTASPSPHPSQTRVPPTPAPTRTPAPLPTADPSGTPDPLPTAPPSTGPAPIPSKTPTVPPSPGPQPSASRSPSMGPSSQVPPSVTAPPSSLPTPTSTQLPTPTGPVPPSPTALPGPSSPVTSTPTPAISPPSPSSSSVPTSPPTAVPSSPASVPVPSESPTPTLHPPKPTLPPGPRPGLPDTGSCDRG